MCFFCLTLQSKNKYPLKEDFKKMAEEIQEKADKIENWFKQKRRKAVTDGKMTFEVRKSLIYKLLNDDICFII